MGFLGIAASLMALPVNFPRFWLTGGASVALYFGAVVLLFWPGHRVAGVQAAIYGIGLSGLSFLELQFPPPAAAPVTARTAPAQDHGADVEAVAELQPKPDQVELPPFPEVSVSPVVLSPDRGQQFAAVLSAALLNQGIFVQRAQTANGATQIGTGRSSFTGRIATYGIERDGTLSIATHAETSVGAIENIGLTLTRPEGDTRGTLVTVLVLADAGRGDDVIQGPDESSVLRGLEGDDIISGGSRWDTIWGDWGDDTIHGGEGNDLLIGQQGNDTIYGDGAADTIYGDEGSKGTYEGDDHLDGGAGNDTIYGGPGNDVILGGLGNDNLYGGVGNDRIEGGWGNDHLIGSDGDDELTGGSGSDVFWFFGKEAGVDTISDFSIDDGDLLEFSNVMGAYDVVGKANLSKFVKMAIHGNDTHIFLAELDGMPARHYITLQGVQVSLNDLISADSIVAITPLGVRQQQEAIAAAGATAN